MHHHGIIDSSFSRINRLLREELTTSAEREREGDITTVIKESNSILSEIRDVGN